MLLVVLNWGQTVSALSCVELTSLNAVSSVKLDSNCMCC